MLAALLALTGEQENIVLLVDAIVPQAALAAIGEEGMTTTVLVALAKRAGPEAVVGIEWAIRS
jgi:hypothetical protein